MAAQSTLSGTIDDLFSTFNSSCNGAATRSLIYATIVLLDCSKQRRAILDSAPASFKQKITPQRLRLV